MSASAFQQVTAFGLVIGAGNGCQVHAQLRGQQALRRQPVARLQQAVRHGCLQGICNLQEAWPTVRV